MCFKCACSHGFVSRGGRLNGMLWDSLYRKKERKGRPYKFITSLFKMLIAGQVQGAYNCKKKEKKKKVNC